MPKVKGPLFSVSARKTLGKLLTFQRRPGGAAVYPYKKPKVPLTAKQILQRWLVAQAVACWQGLSDADKAVWELKAKGRGQSGYSLFIHKNTAIGYNMFLAPDFSIGAGSVLPDLSRYKSHGAITGASWADGLHGKCLDFDPLIPSYVEIPKEYTQLNFTSEDFSFIARIYIDDLTANRRVFTRGLGYTDGYALHIRSTGAVWFDTDQASEMQLTASAVASIASGAWYTLGVSRAGASGIIFINGVDSNTTVGVHENPTSNSRTAKIGIYDDLSGEPFDGKIEFLRVFGGIALSEADHLAWHNALK